MRDWAGHSPGEADWTREGRQRNVATAQRGVTGWWWRSRWWVAAVVRVGFSLEQHSLSDGENFRGCSYLLNHWPLIHTCHLMCLTCVSLRCFRGSGLIRSGLLKHPKHWLVGEPNSGFKALAFIKGGECVPVLQRQQGDLGCVCGVNFTAPGALCVRVCVRVWWGEDRWGRWASLLSLWVWQQQGQ